MAWKAEHADDWQNVKRRGWKQIRTALTEEREVGKGFYFLCKRVTLYENDLLRRSALTLPTCCCTCVSVCISVCKRKERDRELVPRGKGP